MSKALSTAEQERDEIMEELLGEETPEPQAEDGDVAEAEEPEAEPEDEATDDEPETEEEPEDEADADEEGDDEDEVEPLPAAAKAESKPLPKKALHDVVKLRQKNRELKEKLGMQQAPQPGSQQTPSQGYQNEPEQKIPVKVDPDTGEQYVDTEALAALQRRQAQANQPSPMEMAQRGLREVRDRFVAKDPARNGPAVQRVDVAAERLDMLTARTMQEIGYTTTDPDSWLQAMQDTGALAEFHEDFGEIEDVQRFGYAVAQARGGNSLALRYWLDDYMATGYASLFAEPGEDATEESEVQRVKPLPKGRPRSMAKKGDSGPADEGLEAELKRLERAVDYDPVGMDPGTEKKLAKIEQIRKKLKLDR